MTKRILKLSQRKNIFDKQGFERGRVSVVTAATRLPAGRFGIHTLAEARDCTPKRRNRLCGSLRQGVLGRKVYHLDRWTEHFVVSL
jgi:hypothetical protein